MVEQQDGGEEEGGKVGAPEEDVELQPGEVECEERDEREDELGQDRPRDLAEVPRQEARVEVRAVEHGRPEVREEEDEVSMIPVEKCEYSYLVHFEMINQGLS